LKSGGKQSRRKHLEEVKCRRNTRGMRRKMMNRSTGKIGRTG
jgi:hypothetical protein